MTAIEAIATPVAKRRGSLWLFYAGLAILGVAVLAAVFAPLVAPYDSAATDFSLLYSPPTGAHWLGTDQLGRDVLSRLIYGARPSLLGAIALLAFATVLGVLIGVVAAWRRGWGGAVPARLTHVMFAFTGLLFV